MIESEGGPDRLAFVKNQDYRKEPPTMGKNYRKKTNRSRRIVKEPDGQVLGVEQNGVQLFLPIAELLAGVKGALEDLVIEAGLLVVKSLLDEEVEAFVGGARYAHLSDRRANRWGHEEGFIILGGRKIAIERPRVRRDGREVELERYKLFQHEKRAEETVMQRMVRGVSTRDYEGITDAVWEGYGVRKSSVSRRWKAASRAKLEELLGRSVADLDIVSLIIDGIEFHGNTVVVAMGVTSDGQKKVLGLWEGATENSELCKRLLADLIDRGLDTSENLLLILDGAKALHKAVNATFGDKGIVQRCQVHKERNVLSYLPAEYHSSIRQRLRAAWGMNDYKAAKKALFKVAEYLEGISASAASSLREGLEETLTLHRRPREGTNPRGPESPERPEKALIPEVQRARRPREGINPRGPESPEAQRRH